MKKTAAHSTTNISSDSNASFNALNIGRELLDTTWRIAVPVLLLAGIGIVLDRQFDTKPWITLSGVLVGFFFAGILVKRQIIASEADDTAHDHEEPKQ